MTKNTEVGKEELQLRVTFYRVTTKQNIEQINKD